MNISTSHKASPAVAPTEQTDPTKLDVRMATRSKTRGLSQDAKRVSYEKHEIEYTSNKLASEMKLPKLRVRVALISAKKILGRTTARNVVENATKNLASK